MNRKNLTLFQKDNITLSKRKIENPSKSMFYTVLYPNCKDKKKSKQIVTPM